SVTVDASATYLAWAEDNLALNGVAGGEHVTARAECREYLARARAGRRRFTLCVVDPPSFSDRGPGGAGFDVQRDHPALLREVLAVMAPGGVVWFSTNHARFQPDLAGLPADDVRELTRETQPPDFRRTPHRVWRMRARPVAGRSAAARGAPGDLTAGAPRCRGSRRARTPPARAPADRSDR